MDRCSATFENGISDSFNSRIVEASGKPIINMLEDIRVYIMQRMFCMNKLSFDNKDSITPLVRRQMEYNKRIQRHWLVFPSGYKEEAPSSSMPPPTATPSTSNTMPPPSTPSTSNTMSPPLTPSPSTLNTMPLPSSSNTMPPPPTPYDSNTMRGSNTMPSHATYASTGTNKGKGGYRKGGSKGGARGGTRGGARSDESKRGRGSSKRGRGSNTIPFQGLKDKASDDENQFKMDMKAVYEMEKEQMAIDEDDQFWEECARKFDHVEDVAAGKQPMTEDESTVEVNPKPTRSQKSKATKVPNQMRIFHKNKGRYERIFNQKMKNFKFDEHGTGSSPDKAFDVE
ncbi:hypothetical protein Tco_0639737 [Tanacetum coccineum]